MSYSNEAYIGQTAQQSVPVETATQVLSETMQMADKLISRILHMSNRLCGEEPPTSTGAQDASKQADGVLPAIKDQSRDMQRRLHQAENALDRIEALL